MNAIKAVVRNGRIEPEEPFDFPEGTELVISVPEDSSNKDDDDDWDNSPEGIADWLKWYGSLEPLIFTEEERAAWEVDRQARKEWEKAHFDEYAEKLKRMWE